MFHIPTQEKIFKHLSGKGKSAPGSSGISYKALFFCDPAGILIHQLFKIVLEGYNTPAAWKNYITLMISKSGKDGEYHLQSSWRGIALKERIYKLLTTLQYKQLIG